MEPNQFLSLIVENRLEDLRKRYVGANPDLTDENFDKLADLDPTATKKYLPWLLSHADDVLNGKAYVPAKRTTEPVIGKIKDCLDTYDKNGGEVGGEHRDLFTYTPQELYAEIQNDEAQQEKQKGKYEANILYDDGQYMAVTPKTPRAAAWYGRGTIYGDSEQAFSGLRGSLVIVIDKTSHGEKWTVTATPGIAITDPQGRPAKPQTFANHFPKSMVNAVITAIGQRVKRDMRPTFYDVHKTVAQALRDGTTIYDILRTSHHPEHDLEVIDNLIVNNQVHVNAHKEFNTLWEAFYKKETDLNPLMVLPIRLIGQVFNPESLYDFLVRRHQLYEYINNETFPTLCAFLNVDTPKNFLVQGVTFEDPNTLTHTGWQKALTFLCHHLRRTPHFEWLVEWAVRTEDHSILPECLLYEVYRRDKSKFEWSLRDLLVMKKKHPDVNIEDFDVLGDFSDMTPANVVKEVNEHGIDPKRLLSMTMDDLANTEPTQEYNRRIEAHVQLAAHLFNALNIPRELVRQYLDKGYRDKEIVMFLFFSGLVGLHHAYRDRKAPLGKITMRCVDVAAMFGKEHRAAAEALACNPVIQKRSPALADHFKKKVEKTVGPYTIGKDGNYVFQGVKVHHIIQDRPALWKAMSQTGADASRLVRYYITHLAEDKPELGMQATQNPDV